jgi:hypothetical protein
VSASFAARQLHLIVVPLLFSQECSLLTAFESKAQDHSAGAVKLWRLRADGDLRDDAGRGNVARRLPPIWPTAQAACHTSRDC